MGGTESERHRRREDAKAARRTAESRFLGNGIF